jgi:hypothetical protein
MTDETLQSYFKFDDADLESNRSGKFSEKQKARLAALNTRERNSRKMLGIFLVSLAGFVLVAIPFFYRNHYFSSVILPFGLICGVIGIIFLRAKYKTKVIG